MTKISNNIMDLKIKDLLNLIKFLGTKIDSEGSKELNKESFEQMNSTMSFAQLQAKFNETIFIRRIIKLGNSLAITLPLRIINDLKITTEQNALLEVNNNSLSLHFIGNNSPLIQLEQLEKQLKDNKE